jgi:hypothetical protein
MIEQLRHEPITLEFEAGAKSYQGYAQAIEQTLHDGIYDVFEITLNDKNLGLIRRMKSGWKMELITDKKLIRAIGSAIEENTASAK